MHGASLGVSTSVVEQHAAHVREGARLFDEQAYFEAHEVWEERWRVVDGEERRVLQGLIQIAAALHKLLVMESPAPASRLFARGLAKLGDVETLQGLDLVAFRERVRVCADLLDAGRFDRAAIPRFSSR